MNIFKEFKKIDPEIEFHGRKNIIVKKEEDFPQSKETYEQTFEYCNNPPGPRMVVATHIIRSTKTFGELKFGDPAIMKYLANNNTHIKKNSSRQLIVSIIGFIINVPVFSVWKEGYVSHLKKEIIGEMTMSEMRRIQEAREVEENSDIDFILDVITKKQGFGNTDRVITDAFEIQTSPKYGTIIKDIIIRLNERKRLRGKFIAQGIV